MNVMHIAYDSREQRPLHKMKQYGQSALIEYHEAALQTFDYCLWRDWQATDGKIVVPEFAIERKSVEDFIGSWFNKTNKAREVRKIARAFFWHPRPTIYVLEGGMAAIAAYDYSRFESGTINARTVEAVIDKLRYAGTQVIMAGSRYMAEYVIVSLLKRRMQEEKAGHWRELWKDKEEASK